MESCTEKKGTEQGVNVREKKGLVREIGLVFAVLSLVVLSYVAGSEKNSLGIEASFGLNLIGCVLSS